MDKIYRLLTALFCCGVVLAFASCSDDDTDITSSTSGSCVVTAVTLGGIPCAVHTTTDDGRDSIYEASLTGANYPLSIDQRENRIYLQDSLPAGCDVSRMTFSTFTYQGSDITIRSLYTGNDTIFNTADSTDCHVPRIITVHSADGSQRSYTLELKVHKQSGEEMNWTCVQTNSEIAALSEQRMLEKDGTLYLFGRNGGQFVLLVSADGGDTWTREDVSSDLMVRSVQLKGGTFFALDMAGHVQCSSDGRTWIQGGDKTLNVLVASSNSLFGTSEGGIWSSLNATEWSQDGMDEAAPLPLTEWNGLSLPSRTNTSFEEMLLTGLDADGNPALWFRTIDLSGQYTFPWNNLKTQESNGVYPLLQSTALVAYDDSPLLIGLKEGSEVPALYISRDRGRSWLDTEIESPVTAAATSLSATVDAKNNIFIACGGSGEVWRGKLARLGWRKVQTTYQQPRFGNYNIRLNN